MSRLDLPEAFKDGLYTKTQTHFSFWDRLKVLIGYTFETETCTYLEFVVNKRMQGETRVLFLRPTWFPRLKPIAYCVEATNGKNETPACHPASGN